VGFFGYLYIIIKKYFLNGELEGGESPCHGHSQPPTFFKNKGL